MLLILLPLYTAITARQSGGGLGAARLPKKLTWLPEVFFSLAFAIPYLQLPGYLILTTVPVIAWCYIWMQTGHGVVLPWGESFDPNRKQFLTPVVNRLADLLGITHGSIQYARLFMGLKGFLIGLPVGGIPLMILWPLGYELGYRMHSDPMKELLSGFGAGLSILLFLILVF